MNVVSDRVLLAAVLRHDLGSFIAKVFQTVSPGDLYLHNWHIDAITYALLQVHAGDTRRLIITQPPRSLKSICTSVAFVAWSLGHDPSKRFACVSYSQELAATFARQFRLVVNSAWYRALFPHVRLAKDTETECATTKGGGRITVPVGGSFTGRGADIIIVDDPMKASDAQSEAARRTVNDWYATTLLSRLDDKEKGTIILVMQRLHEDDLAGKLLREGHWRHLHLPAIAEDEEEIPIGPGVIHRRKRGEEGIKKLIGETGKFQDWGGERNDLYTTKIRIAGKRRPCAFAFKGPGTRGVLTPKKLGKNGDQIQRLFESPAEVFLVQYHDQIDESVITQMREFAKAKSVSDGTRIWYGVIDGDDTARLLSVYPRQFTLR